jgi:hypothetical protein
MSSIPLISHRMLAAAAAQEHEPSGRLASEEPSSSGDGYVTVELLDLPPWATFGFAKESSGASAPAESEV